MSLLAISAVTGRLRSFAYSKEIAIVGELCGVSVFSAIPAVLGNIVGIRSATVTDVSVSGGDLRKSNAANN